MVVTLWGVRGTTPVPGPRTLRYGGNTTCISVEVEDRVLIIDAGTGIRELGAALQGGTASIFLLLTHVHNDHVQGFPFFAPLYEPGRVVHVLDYERAGTIWSPLDLFDGVHMPVRRSDLPGEPRRVAGDGLAFLREQGFAVTRQAVNHPGGAYGYRIDHGTRALVFIPDSELVPPGNDPIPFEEIAAFCRGASVLCHDAQYVEGDMPVKWGWGHSQLHQTCDLAVAAQVEHLVLVHHDPDRDDDALDAMQAAARDRLRPHGIDCTAAYEGLRLTL